MYRNNEVIQTFSDLLNDLGESGDIGFCSFQTVYNNLLPIQQEKLRSITGTRFGQLCKSGSMVSIAVAYQNPIIDFIDKREGSTPDYNLWNEYAHEYHRINQTLNQIAKSIATDYDGIPLPATIGGVMEKVQHVHDYFGMVVSHRVVAELAGVGWRGKNQLIIHDRFSCAVRFSSVIVSIPLEHGTQLESKCGECTACEDVCSFIKYRSKLPDYRENCRRYILFLKSKGLEKDVCGKCVKACYRSSMLSRQFQLKDSDP
ncbi:MAG: hypothetical protein ACTSU3_02935 [Candidatus Thorarchaeota archaeon]